MDSGADANLIDAGLTRKLGLRSIPFDEPLKVTALNG